MTILRPTTDLSEKTQSPLGRITALFVGIFERVMPDPFIFAVSLTFVGALLAY